jgi:hypothetical protein
MPLGVIFVLDESSAFGLREGFRFLFRLKGEDGFVVINRHDDCMNGRAFRVRSRRCFNVEGHCLSPLRFGSKGTTRRTQ